jgi:hypothetical protein
MKARASCPNGPHKLTNLRESEALEAEPLTSVNPLRCRSRNTRSDAQAAIDHVCLVCAGLRQPRLGGLLIVTNRTAI